MSDQDIVNGLKHGDQDTFRKLVEQHQIPLMRLCKGFLQNDEDAKDIVQETFIEVFQSIQQFRSDSKLSTWIYRIAVNKSLNHVRKNKINHLIDSLDIFSSARNSSIEPRLQEQGKEQPGMKLEHDERLRHIKHAINSLPYNQRIAFVLSKYQDLSYLEVADVMEISLSSVESLIHRAKMNLQKKLFGLYKKNLI
jgi:RNA polymerase sigma-70 factor, ECF subfamily